MVLNRIGLAAALLLASRVSGAQRSDGPRVPIFGFALECVKCESRGPGLRGFGRAGGPFAVWHYSEFPRVSDVAPGSAADRSGVRVGDILMSIDGMSLLTDEGSRRLSAVRAGDQVKLGLERGKKLLDVTLTLGRQPGERLRQARSLAGLPDYSARVAGAAVDVWSPAPVIASTDSTGATVLTIGNITIRLRKEGTKP